ncbi:excinuclease ATPase subunit [Massilia cellulosiltytica]|uniref:excinuclease ATPase subunit n=1 Tax=Massilia cellulosiltytica TaxID=2683234 RepID=UPI0039B62B4D
MSKKMQAVLACALLALGVTTAAQARDTKLLLPLSAAMSANGAQSRLGDSVKFYFGNQPTLKVLERLGSDQTSQKTNSVGKSPETACNWAFLSAMLRLQQRARELGADAVINIVSNYKNVEMSSDTQFECHDGAIMSGVALKGEFVKLAK